MASTAGSIDYTISDQWNDGFVTTIDFTPDSLASGWRIEVTFDGEIANVWNARIVERVGNTYVLENADYNGSLAAGQTVSFGFQADGTDTTLAFDGATPGEPASLPEISVSGGSVSEGDPATTPTTPAANGSVMGPLSTEGNQIVNAAGESVTIEAVNWFGMETTNLAPHGLWTRNWQEMMDEIKETGFNAIRLPFSLQSVLDQSVNPNGIDAQLNPDLQGLSPLEVLDRIVAYAEEIELGIILDNHRSAAGNGPNPNGSWYDGGYSEPDWISAWQLLAERYGDSDAIIGADLVNEPHSPTWGDWASAAERAGNAVLEIAPDWLILVEGVGAYNGETYWWGGSLKGVADRPVVLSADDKLVYSPHDYPASVYAQPWFTDGSDLYQVFRENWGFIHENGIAPILVGEFGSRLETAVDRAWADAIVAYLGGDFDGDGSVDPDAVPMNFAWWSWNPNSGDTGGILLDDWRTLRQNAIDLLDPLLEDGGGGGGAEGETLRFEVVLGAASDQTITVSYETQDGSAVAGEDYDATSGTLTFRPGETVKFVDVAVLPDLIAEGDETVLLSITGPAGRAQAVGTISDDDTGTAPSTLPTLSIAGMRAAEDDGEAVVTVSLSKASADTVTVAFATADGTARAGEDYVATNGTLTFAPGETVKLVTVDLLDDTVAESLEAFDVLLSTPTGATLAGSVAKVTVTDSDVATPPPPPPPPPAPESDLTVSGDIVNDWGSGAQVSLTLFNGGDTAVDGWTLSFDAPAAVTQLWGGDIVSRDGMMLTVDELDWNGRIAPGTSVEIGFLTATGNIDEAAWLSAADFEIV